MSKLDDAISKFEAAKRRIPRIIGNHAVNFYKENFRRQGFLDRTISPWARRKTTAGRRSDNRGILIGKGSGRLWRSIRMTEATMNRIVIRSETPYAIAHNEGFTGTVNVRAHHRNTYGKAKASHLSRKGNVVETNVKYVAATGQVKAHTRKMDLPKRQFIGESATLRDELYKRMNQEIRKAFNLG